MKPKQIEVDERVAIELIFRGDEVEGFWVRGGNLLCTLDGSEPSPTNGHLIMEGGPYHWDEAVLKTAKWVRA